MRIRYASPFAAVILLSLWLPNGLQAQDANSAPPPAQAKAAVKAFQYFSFMHDPQYASVEKIALWVVLGVAVAGLVYAMMLVGQVLGADQGTEKMRTIAEAIRLGANAYMRRQTKAIVSLVFLITVILYFASTGEGESHVSLGRALAFLVGAGFSWIVGYVGMGLAVRGNLRV
ncbi:sodium/proton-translocating pyrophosphatase, partial [Singulisphaera rosea]